MTGKGRVGEGGRIFVHPPLYPLPSREGKDDVGYPVPLLAGLQGGSLACRVQAKSGILFLINKYLLAIFSICLL
jgi:hypothetical protein